jgi:hypothetical protein
MTSKTPADLRHWLNSGLGFLSALLCGTFLSSMSIFFLLWPFTVWFILLLVGIKDAFRSNTGNAQYLIPDIVSALISILAVYAGVVSGRFLLRAAPPRFSGRVRTGMMVLLVCLALALALVTIYLLSEMYIDLRYKIIFSVSSIMWLAGLSIPFVSRHLRPRAFLAHPFVLHLRRFSTFSDRAVISVVLKASPAGVPVVFLTPTRTRAGDWNPFLIGLAGIKMWAPFRSIPITLRARDEDWKAAAEELIQHARLIIIDMSEGSDAIHTEIAMISAAARWSNTVIIERRMEDKAVARGVAQECEKCAYLYYKKSWISAMPRLVGGFLLIVCLWPLAWMFSGYIVAAIMLTFAKYGYELEGVLGNYRTVLPLFLLITLPYGYYSFFVRPSVDRQLGDKLRTLLQR